MSWHRDAHVAWSVVGGLFFLMSPPQKPVFIELFLQHVPSVPVVGTEDSRVSREGLRPIHGSGDVTEALNHKEAVHSEVAG